MPLFERTCAIALAGVLAGAVHSAFHAPVVVKPLEPAQAAVPANPSDGQSAQPPPPPTQTLGLEITLDQAWTLYEEGVPFVDARHREEYEAGHVQNAFLVQAEDFLAGKRPVALDFLDPGARVVIYCGGGDCDASKNLAILLQQAGFKSCHIMHDGYPAWAAAGRPTASGKPEYE